ncbi:TraX family protein [Pseudomonas sp. R5(2019)]|uniref:TraX family protein n=1 Tax=Pseudomonas sp. R5(2019) TaxID=2697566 RepID=UPI0014131E9B|nr:TraX family protein [Pseudomonas sp. R5(2019)]NBA93750.1 conjugal transfer protein TraX [Pseudomonas sp. R5(2019)]
MTTLTATAPGTLKTRSASLDLIKWIGLLTMLLDHMRLVWPHMVDLFILGRFSFPFFCLAIAANVARAKPGEFLTAANARYFTLMVVFGALSEVPYHFIGTSGTFNVLPTLALGLVVAWGVQHRTAASVVLAVIAVGVGYALDKPLMYGFHGVLVPAALLLAIKKPGILWSLPSLLCLLINSRTGLLGRAAGLEMFALLSLATAVAAPLIGLWLLRQRLTFKVWPVRQWGYWFYPGHMVALQAVRVLM